MTKKVPSYPFCAKVTEATLQALAARINECKPEHLRMHKAPARRVIFNADDAHALEQLVGTDFLKKIGDLVLLKAIVDTEECVEKGKFGLDSEKVK